MSSSLLLQNTIPGFDAPAVRPELKVGAKHSSRRSGPKRGSGDGVFVPREFVAAVSGMKSAELKVYLLLRAAARDGQVVGVTIDDLAATADLSTRMVLKALRSLEKGKWFCRRPRPGRLSNVYLFPDGSSSRRDPKSASGR